jgi:lantibiotic modifying enzyme
LSVNTPKIKPFLQDINEILLGNLSDYLAGADNQKFNTMGNYEVIMGLSGPLRYLLNFNGDERMNEMVQQIIDVFIKRSKDITILDKRVTGWHYYPSESEASFMPVKAINGVVNYGVSHGMGGPLATLSLVYNNGVRTEGLLDAINGLISEYMNALYYVDDIAYWPGRITFEQYVGLDEIPEVAIASQMSWCYGSVGILRVLFIAGDLMSNEELKQFALDELVKIAKMDLSEYALTQPIVCHGYIGTAAILNLMYLDTNKIEFLQKTTEMVETSIAFNIERYIENENHLAKMRDTSSRASLHGHLEGYNGIIQTILSIIKGLPNENEKRLVMF